MRIGHVALYVGNAGDTMLIDATRKLFGYKFGKIEWIDLPLRVEWTQERVEFVNKNCDALIVGGGGLFFPGSPADSVSGWQWNCHSSLINKIKVPSIVFAAGYNRFRGQKDFKTIFDKNLKTIIKKSCFIGIRSNGSIKRLSEYVNKRTSANLRFQPCPTTLISKLYNIKKSEGKVCAINFAADKSKNRYGKNKSYIHETINNICNRLISQGWKIKLFVHRFGDGEIKEALYCKYELVNISRVSPEEILKEFSEIKLMIGTRGHSILISFGMQIPSLSLISHAKLKWFLEDIKNPEWGIDVRRLTADSMYRKILDIKNGNYTIKKIQKEQDFLWETSLENMEEISKCLR